ncbi:peroxidase 55 [Physcomitrium patens]|uniref:Peroxidase n=1 Tax=Physcomitrium patens TaxID=3218 RepID=A0A2K1IYM6_PHYPA|nr:peroxidase 55-like [Physcomitrium patens]PNR34380.1 hypothetical protein PHYPA_024197 [Physcomitrium patens]|eukprot:XP_024403579.1 peroxidase 55-like [Physcomitrella patens]
MRTTNMAAALTVRLPLLCILLMCLASVTTIQAQLSTNFYRSTCKDAETIISVAVTSALSRRPAAAAGIIRMLFHDCFVHGCDASVLIDSPSEKDAAPNQSLQGFDVIDEAKAAVEAKCPGIVSCSDVLALAAQISVRLLSDGTITYPVALGRRDGLVSNALLVTGRLPPPTASATTLKLLFKAVGLSTEDMVVLSGAHSIGKARCSFFRNRLTTPSDANMDPDYAESLKRQCPADKPNNLVDLDVTTPTNLDSEYYKNLQVNKGLLTSDQNLQSDPETQPMVSDNAEPGTFRTKFADAIRRMSNIGVLTGSAGEIRLNCRRFN